MSRTLNQQMGDLHEADIAEWIGGSQTKGSGNQWHNQMDAKNGTRKVPFPIAGDGKSTLGKSLSDTRELWKKFEDQSFGEIPVHFKRFYADQTLRRVDRDLVTLRVDDFVRLLEAARKWVHQENEKEARLVEFERQMKDFDLGRALICHVPAEVSCANCKHPLGTIETPMDSNGQPLLPPGYSE